MSFVHFTAKTHRYISKSAYEYVPQIDILMFVFILRACCCFLLYVYYNLQCLALCCICIYVIAHFVIKSITARAKQHKHQQCLKNRT